MEEVYTSSSDFVKHLLEICEKLQIACVVVVVMVYAKLYIYCILAVFLCRKNCMTSCIK